MEKLKKFFGENFDFVIKLSIGLFVLYWFFYFLTPKTEMSDVDKKKLDILIEKMDEITKKQKKMDSSLLIIDKELLSVSDSIKNLKERQIIINKIYHEKIISIRQLNDSQLDSFFTERYGNLPR